MKEEIKLMWADPRFQVYAKVLHLLEGDRIWGGQDWVYHPKLIMLVLRATMTLD